MQRQSLLCFIHIGKIVRCVSGVQSLVSLYEPSPNDHFDVCHRGCVTGPLSSFGWRYHTSALCQLGLETPQFRNQEMPRFRQIARFERSDDLTLAK